MTEGPDRYCGTCGRELSPEDQFCRNCGRPVHTTAHVPTPDADVSVPPPPDSSQNQQSEASERVPGRRSRLSKAESTRNAYTALIVVVWIMVFLGAVGSGSAVATTVVFTIGLALLAIALLRPDSRGAAGRWSLFITTDPREGDTDPEGRLILRSGSQSPIPEAARTRILDEEVSEYMREGYFVRERTATTAQMIKPKQFSFIWALLWFLFFGIGIVIYLIYYAAKQDEGRYVEVDEYGAVKAARQIRRILP